MISGIGTDIIEISRIEKACQNPRFITRNFTENERAIFEKTTPAYHRIALHFAIKEAVVKAMGTGLRKINLIDIEVLRDELGKPYIAENNTYCQRLVALGIEVIHVSGSHCKAYATGYAVAEKKRGGKQ